MAQQHKERILIIGACALDRLLYVPYYPKEDAKILCCRAMFEFGGGNAANTASGLGRLSDSSQHSTKVDNNNNETIINEISDNDISNCYSTIKIQLLTKIGNDDIQFRLCHELNQYNVDLSSPLFLIHPSNITHNTCTSPVATIIVSTNDKHSRTCFYDKGSCGILEPSDVIHKIHNNYNEFFNNVTMIHSDTRHTDAAVLLVKEAKCRGVIISLDLERDRLTESFDQLIDCASIIFMSESQNQLKSILERRRMKEQKKKYACELSLLNNTSSYTIVQMKDESFDQLYGYYIDIVLMFHELIKSTNNQSLELIVTR